MDLVEITEKKYSVYVDLAYAKNKNFTGKKIYLQNKCYIHKDALPRLLSAILIAHSLGYTFRIYDAYRPIDAQKVLWEFFPDKNFITPPNIGSPHSRGIAIDLTLMKNNKVLDMGTKFDYLYKESHHGNTDIPKIAQKNRLILLGIMTAAGWDYYENEWWHYQLHNSKTWPLITKPEDNIDIMKKEK
jgi:zinc D-Ala-D-Ala dipeptidase